MQPVPAEAVRVYAASAAQPWLKELFACANENSIAAAVNVVEPDIILRVARLGFEKSESEKSEFEKLGLEKLGFENSLRYMGNNARREGGAEGGPVFHAYQIGEEEIVIAVNRESPIQTLTIEEVRTLFAGQGIESAQVWVYASGEDLQEAFDQIVMKGRGVTSFARVAANPQEMAAVLNSESNAVGILPQRWVAGNIRAVHSLGRLPVLALTREEPQGNAKALLACLQRGR